MDIFDIAVIGGGPAGLSAALTGKIRRKSVVIFEQGVFSEKLQKAHQIDNYLGLPGITGKELMDALVNHTMSFDPEVIKEKVLNVYPGKIKTIVTPHSVYQAKAVILATGSGVVKVLKGEKEFLGKGVSYCATCDGAFFKNKTIAICLYAKNEVEDVHFLAELAKKIYLIPLYSGEPLSFPENVEIVEDKPQAVEGECTVRHLLLSQRGKLEVDGVFFLRETPPLDNMVEGISLEKNAIVVNRKQESNLEGLFAAGDVTGGPLQISKAIGEGQVAGLQAITYINKK